MTIGSGDPSELAELVEALRELISEMRVQSSLLSRLVVVREGADGGQTDAVDPTASKALWSVEDVAAKLGIGERKAREVMRALQHVRVGKLLMIRPDVLERWSLRGGDQYGAQRASEPMRAAPTQRTPSNLRASKFSPSKPAKRIRDMTYEELMRTPVRKRKPRSS